VFLVLFIGLNLSDRISFSLPFCISQHLNAVRLHVFLHSTLGLHIVLEFLGQIFDCTLVHLVSVLEFLNNFQLFLLIVKLVEDTAENVISAFDLCVFKLSINLVSYIVISSVYTLSVSLTHLVLMIFVSLLALFSLNQLVVDVLELL
jgi:hypothetical protein